MHYHDNKNVTDRQTGTQADTYLYEINDYHLFIALPQPNPTLTHTPPLPQPNLNLNFLVGGELLCLVSLVSRLSRLSRPVSSWPFTLKQAQQC